MPGQTTEVSAKETKAAGKETSGKKGVSKKEEKKELKEERTTNSTTYQLENGRKQTEFFSGDVRFQDEETNQLVDYDATLKKVKGKKDIQGESLTGYSYENKKGDDKNYMPEVLSEETPVISESEAYQVAMTPLFKEVDLLAGETKKETVEDIYGEEKEAVTSVIYGEDEKGVQYDYESLQNGIKETIILPEKPQSNRFVSQIVLKNAFAVAEGEAGLNDEEIKKGKNKKKQMIPEKYGINIYNDKNELKGYIPAGNMNDATGKQYCEDCSYELEKIETKKDGENFYTTYRLTVCVDESYLNQEELVYPVEIDPTYYWMSGNADRAMNDGYVRSGTNKEKNYSTNVKTIIAGRLKGDLFRSFLHIGNLKSTLKGKYVVSANLVLKETSDCCAGVTVNAKRITSDWDHTKITYTKQPSVASTVYGSVTTSGTSGKEDNINLTSFTKGLLAGSYDNHGICLVSSQESTTSTNKYGRFHNSMVASSKPKLVVTYCEPPTVPTNITFSPVYIKPGGSTQVTWSGMTSPYISSYEYRINNYDEVNKKETTNAVSYTTLKKDSSGKYAVTMKNASGANLPERCYKIVLHGKDSQGNVGGGDGRLVYVDGTAPQITTVRLNQSNQFFYQNVLPTVSWSGVSDNRKLASIKVSVNGRVYDTGTTDASGSYLCKDKSSFVNGKNTIQVLVYDAAGNVKKSTEEYYYYDGTAPVVQKAVLSPATTQAKPSSQIPVLNYTVTDNHELSKVLYSMDGSNYTAISLGIGSGSFSLPEKHFRNSGKYTIYVKGEDASGNVSQVKTVEYYYKDNSTDYLPKNVIVKEEYDGTTEVYWDKCYDKALPATISYSLYRSKEEDFTPSSSNLVQENIKDHKLTIKNDSYDESYYYKLCAVKSSGTEELSRSGYTQAVCSTIVDEEESSRRLGELFFAAKESVTLPDGSAAIEKDNGNLTYVHKGLSLPAVHLSVDVAPAYNSTSHLNGVMGKGWRLPFERSIRKNQDAYIYADETGAKHTFTKQSDGEYKSSTATEFTLTEDEGTFTGGEITCTYQYSLKNGTVTDYFNENGQLAATEESNGSYLIYSYESNYDLLSGITTQTGRQVKFNYDNQLLQAGKARVTSVTFMDAEGTCYQEALRFTYDGDYLTKITQVGSDGTSTLTDTYAYTDGILSKVVSPSGKEYTLGHSGEKITSVTDPSGESTQLTYARIRRTVVKQCNSEGAVLSQTAEQYDSLGRVTSETDNQGNITTYTYASGLNQYQVANTTSKVTYQKLGTDGKVETLSKEKNSTTEYNTDGNVVLETEESGQSTSYDYSGSGGDDQPNKIVEKDSNGQTVSEEIIDYDSNGNVVEETQKDDDETSVTANEYDAAGNQTDSTSTLQGQESSSTQSQYDEEGNITQETVTSGTTSDETKTTYDDMGRVLTEKSSAEGTTTSYEYDVFGRTISTKVTYDKTGKTETETQSYDKEGNVTQETSKDGVVTSYSYDNLNRVIQETITKGETRTRTYTYSYEDITLYGGDGIEKTIEHASKKTTTNQNGIITDIQYSDGNGQTVRTFSNGIYTDTLYDESGHTIVTNVLGTKLEANGNRVTLQLYDENGNVTIAIQNPEIQKGAYYAGDNCLKTESTYDADGNLISQTDANGNTTKYTYNSSKKLEEVTKADGTKGNRYTYSQANEEKQTLTDTVVNAKGYMSKTVSNAAGQTLSVEDYGEDGEKIITSYEYDSTGNKIKEVYGTGAYLTYSYDAKNQLETVRSFDKDKNQTTETNYTYDVNGNITRMTDYSVTDGNKKPLRTTVSEYDYFQRLVKYAEIDGTDNPSESELLSNSISYTYDSQDRLTKIRYAQKDGVTGLNYHYNDYDWLTQIDAVVADGDAENKTVTLRSYTYDQYGKVKSIEDSVEFLQGGKHQIQKNYSYDAFDRVIKMVYLDCYSNVSANTNNDNDSTESDVNGSSTENNASIEKQSYEYTYDKNSNILSKKEKNIYPETEINKITSYTYDALGQLTESQETDQTANQTVQTKYQYDSVGNRTQVNRNGSVTTYDYNGLNQLVKTNNGTDTRTYTYDGAGNQIKVENSDGNQTHYTYDAKNQLTEVATLNGDTAKTIQKNVYNGDGQRIAKTESQKTTNYFYQNGSLVKTTDENNNLQALYLYGNSSNAIAVEDGTEEKLTTYTYTKDVQGSIIELVGEDGNSVTSYRYDDYGTTTINGKQTAANELAYTGGVYDKTTGEYYLNARYYNPEDGRFLTQDTYRGESTDVDSWNLYTYCGGNPVNYVDPSGHSILGKIGKALGKGAKAAVHLGMRNVGALVRVSPAMNKATKWSGKRFWNLVIDQYLIKYKHWPISAELLRHSLQDKPRNLYFNGNSKIAKAIKGTKVFQKKIKEILHNKKSKFTSKKHSLNFESGDLFGALHFSELWVSGTRMGTKWSLDISMHDYYDFDLEVSNYKKRITTTAGNNIAWSNQYLSIIHNYHSYINFKIKTNGKGQMI